MKNWPTSAYATVGTLLIIGVGSVYLTYVGTRASYRAVGTNDGSISQREETIDHFAKNLHVVNCKSMQLPAGAVTLVAVKTESLVAIPAAGRAYTFCQY